MCKRSLGFFCPFLRLVKVSACKVILFFNRYYSLERMFSIQLLENAKEELSFRTVIRDMQTNYPILQLVLLNPDSWCYSGSCLCTTELAARISMYPTIKLLFSDCSKEKELESRSALTFTSVIFKFF